MGANSIRSSSAALSSAEPAGSSSGSLNSSLATCGSSFLAFTSFLAMVSARIGLAEPPTWARRLSMSLAERISRSSSRFRNCSVEIIVWGRAAGRAGPTPLSVFRKRNRVDGSKKGKVASRRAIETRTGPPAIGSSRNASAVSLLKKAVAVKGGLAANPRSLLFNGLLEIVFVDGCQANALHSHAVAGVDTHDDRLVVRFAVGENEQAGRTVARHRPPPWRRGASRGLPARSALRFHRPRRYCPCRCGR